MKTADDVWFLCVGTDRSTGDSLAPLVGKFLKQAGYTQVVGDLENPAHALNLAERFMREIPAGAFVCAIDACLGKVSSVGRIDVSDRPIRPGAGVGKELGSYGDMSITGIVNVGGFMEYFVLQNTRLSLVHQMAEDIVEIIKVRFPLPALAVV